MFGWLFKRKKLEKVDWDKFDPKYAFMDVPYVTVVTFPNLSNITFHSFNFDKAKDRKEALKYFDAKRLVKKDGGIFAFYKDKTFRFIADEDLFCVCINWGKYDEIGRI